MSVDLQALLAKSVRKYLDALIPGSDEQDDALLESCTALDWMLNDLLDGADGWSRWLWIDGLEAETVNIDGPDQLQIEGWGWWLENGSGAGSIEPFFALVRTSASGNAVVSYTIKFADAERGLVKAHPDPRQTGEKRKHLKPWMFPKKRKRPEKWMFEFRGPTPQVEHETT